MFATYSLNIHRLLTQSIRRRPNLHVKNEHRRIIAEFLLAVCENCSRQCIFFRKGKKKFLGRAGCLQMAIKTIIGIPCSNILANVYIYRDITVFIDGY